MSNHGNNKILGGLSWTDGNSLANLQTMHDFVLQNAIQDMAWYRNKSKKYRWRCNALRFLSLVLLGFSGIIPLVNILLANNQQIPMVLVTLMMTISGGLVALDKHFGLSTGWVRYISTIQSIENRIDTFELDWQAEAVKYSDVPMDKVQIALFFDLVKNFTSDVNAYIKEETSAWIQEFATSFKDIETIVNKNREISQANKSQGAINIQLKNHSLFPDGWDAQLNGVITHFTGAVGTISNCPTGINKLTVTALQKGIEKKIVKSIKILADTISTEEIELL